MADTTPTWFPLSVDAVSKRVVRNRQGDVFAHAAGLQEAIVIVLVMNAAVRRNSGIASGLSDETFIAGLEAALEKLVDGT